MQDVTDSSFDALVVGSSGPVLVEFWAGWCGPCAAMDSVLTKLAAEYQDRLTICRVNVDENPGVTHQHGIRGVPSLVLYIGSNPVAVKTGALSLPRVRAFLSVHL